MLQQLYNIYKKVHLIALCLLLLASIDPAFANDKWQSHKALTNIVHAYISDHLKGRQGVDYKLSISPIDTRLKLIRCDQKMEAFNPSANNLSSRTTIGVRCTATKPWKVYIPVQIVRYRNIVVAKRALLRGEKLSASSITLARVELSGSHQAYIFQKEHVLGKILSRAINPGKPIKARYLRAANLVMRGQEVILIATTSSIQVRMSGQALADGAKGDLIRVRNLKSKRIVEGIVTKAGTVKVIM